MHRREKRIASIEKRLAYIQAWRATKNLTDEARREIERLECDLLDSLHAEQEGLILDAMSDELPSDPLWPHPEHEARLQQQYDQLMREQEQLMNELDERKNRRRED